MSLDNEPDFQGFRTVEEFLSYCDTHSATERALFHGGQIRLVLQLSGHDDEAKLWDKRLDKWQAVHDGEMRQYTAEARRRIREAEEAAKVRLLGFAGPHRSGKTYLARQVVEYLRKSGRDAELVPSPVSATFKKLGVDPSRKLDFDDRLWIQHAIYSAFSDLITETKADRKNVTLVLDRTPFDFSGYMYADFLNAGLERVQIERMGQYHSLCMSLMVGRQFDQIFTIHNHSDLGFVEEEFKGRNEESHLARLDTIMTAMAIQHSMYAQITDLPRTVGLDERLRYVIANLSPIITGGKRAAT